MVVEKQRKRIVIYLTSVSILTLWSWHIFLAIDNVKNETSEAAFILLQPYDENVSYNTNSLPHDDYTKLVDLNDFKFTLNNFPCNATSRSPFLMILIHSAPDHVSKRNCIRSTWGGYRDSVSLVFLLGSTNSSELQKQIAFENDIYNDIVQGSFRDSYYNLTYKHVMALKWAAYFCPNAKYVLKTDDDVFVNTPFLLKYLVHNFSPWGCRRLLYCSICENCQVKRSYRSKWRVSPMEYIHRTYPPYCFGWAIVYSPDVLYDLYKTAQQSKYFWIDDVYLTGILASEINVTATSMSPIAMSQNQLYELDEDSSIIRNIAFGRPDMTVANVKKLWSLVLKEMP